MRVAHDCARRFVEVSKQQICGLASDAGKRQKLLHRAGDPSAEALKQHLTGEDDVPCLVVIEAAGADIALYLGDIRLRQRFQRRIARKERGRDQIDALVGTLRR